jgi:hypothetical protein
MQLEEIKQAIKEGKRVFHHNEAYEVIQDNIGQYLIKCTVNNSCIGLTWQDKVTLNGQEKDFFTI